jgi:hypothetical protein
VFTQTSTIDKSLLTSSYLVALQIARFKKTFSVGEELIKPSLTAVCNEVFGQSVASKKWRSITGAVKAGTRL